MNNNNKNLNPKKSAPSITNQQTNNSNKTQNPQFEKSQLTQQLQKHRWSEQINKG